MNAPARRRRSAIQFSLRTLFCLVLLVAAFFGGRESMRPAIQAERARAEKERYMAQLRQVDAQLSAVAAQQEEAEAQRAALLESARDFYRAAAEQDAHERGDRKDGGNQ
jgi:cell division protein FtsB